METELQTEKAEQVEANAAAATQEGSAETEAKAKEGFASDAEAEGEEIGISELIAEGWNEIAVGKGYEPVLDKQQEFLKRHSTRFEQKYLRNLKNVLPEVEFAVAHAIVYVPKYTKHHRDNAKKSKK